MLQPGKIFVESPDRAARMCAKRRAAGIEFFGERQHAGPIAAHAQAGGTPFDTGFTAIQTLFTGTIAKVASLVAIVIGGYAFAHGEPGAKKTLAGVAAGSGIAVMAVNVLTWLWGV